MGNKTSNPNLYTKRRWKCGKHTPKKKKKKVRLSSVFRPIWLIICLRLIFYQACVASCYAHHLDWMQKSNEECEWECGNSDWGKFEFLWSGWQFIQFIQDKPPFILNLKNIEYKPRDVRTCKRPNDTSNQHHDRRSVISMFRHLF